jgi:hypothetical protein
MITINGKNYNTNTAIGFNIYCDHEAKIVSGVNTPSGEAVTMLVSGKWHFINPIVK